MCRQRYICSSLTDTNLSNLGKLWYGHDLIETGSALSYPSALKIAANIVRTEAAGLGIKRRKQRICSHMFAWRQPNSVTPLRPPLAVTPPQRDQASLTKSPLSASQPRELQWMWELLRADRWYYSS